MATKMLNTTDGSDMADDFPCSSCLRDNKYVESAQFCMECKDYLCQTCLSYHKRFTATAKHNVIAKSKVLVPKENVTEIDVSFPSDLAAPRDVPGICVVTVAHGTGRYVILTDWYNEMVKVLDINASRIVDSVKLNAKPYGVCELPSSGLIAVTMRDTNELVIMEFNGPHLEFFRGWDSVRSANSTQNFNVKGPTCCRGVAVVKEHFNDNVLIVSGGDPIRKHRNNPLKPTLSVYGSSKTNEVLYPIYSKNIVSTQSTCFPRNIVLSKDCKKVFITDESVGVIVTDINGKEIGTISDPVLKGARGICSDDIGNLYVAGMKSANVVKFTADGQLIGEVVNSSHGLKTPISLCYSGATRSLLIGSKENVPFRIVKL